jgi:hypothetical protein
MTIGSHLADQTSICLPQSTSEQLVLLPSASGFTHSSCLSSVGAL